MSDETMAGAAAASEPQAITPRGDAERADAPSAQPSTEPDSGGTEPAERRSLRPRPAVRPARRRKRRRRGSRGGRNRRKPTTAGGPIDADDYDEDDDGGDDGLEPGADARDSAESDGRGHDERARADRGLTTDDLAETALEDAGLRAPRVGDTRPAPAVPSTRPKVGDSRPAPAGEKQADPGDRNGGGNGGAGTGAPRKRRRRGGRGRSRSGGGGTGARASNAATEQRGRALLGHGGGLRDRRGSRRRDDATPSRSDPEGSPHRPVPDGRARRRAGRHPDGRARGARARGALREPLPGRRHVDRRQHLSRQGAERVAGHGGRVHRHRHPEERRPVPGRRHVRRVRDRRGAAQDRAPAQERPGRARPGDEEPDRRQGRAPHAGGQPRGPVRRDGARATGHLRDLEAAPRRRASSSAQGARGDPTCRRRA